MDMSFKDYLRMYKKARIDTFYIVYTQTEHAEVLVPYTTLDDAINDTQRNMISLTNHTWTYHQIYAIDVDTAYKRALNGDGCGFNMTPWAIEFEESIYSYDFATEINEYTCEVTRG